MKHFTEEGHPQIMKFIDYKNDENTHILYLIMEFCGGGSLQDRLDEYEDEKNEKNEKVKKRYTEKEVIPIIKSVALKLNALHSWKTTHRDIKPDNIFIKGEKGNKKYVIGDFGVSKTISDEIKKLETHTGTPPYIAPEFTKVDEDYEGIPYTSKVDMWALGVTIYRLLFN